MANLRIHISPIGYEFRRVTDPLIHMQADKVYLVRHKKDNKSAKKFTTRIKSEIAKRCAHVKIEEASLGIWDLYECIEKFLEIIKSERNQGNHVYINVSTGTKITAIAGMLACMIGGAHPYYAPVLYRSRSVEVEEAENVQEPETLPTYDIMKPKKEFIKVLKILQENNGTMRKKAMIEKLEEEGLIKKTDETKNELKLTAKHSQLRALLDPMKADWDMINVEASGRRSVVSITEQGKTALRIFGTVS